MKNAKIKRLGNGSFHVSGRASGESAVVRSSDKTQRSISKVTSKHSEMLKRLAKR